MSHKTTVHKARGFTIIELMLAMTFLSFVLVFIVLTLVQMVRTYDKGLTIKQINQAGRTVTEDIAKSVRGEQPGEVVLTHVPEGYLCVGDTLYIWNSVFKTQGSGVTQNLNLNQYTFFPSGTGISLARQKMNANQAALCRSVSGLPASYTVFMNNPDNYSLLGDRARVIWAGATPSPDGRLVKLTFVLGTYDTTEATRIQAGSFSDVYNTPHYENNQPTCYPGSNGNYCAFAEFSTTVYLPNGQ